MRTTSRMLLTIALLTGAGALAGCPSEPADPGPDQTDTPAPSATPPAGTTPVQPRPATDAAPISGPNAAEVYLDTYAELGPASLDILRESASAQFVAEPLARSLRGAQGLIGNLMEATTWECDFDIDYAQRGVDTELPHLRATSVLALMLRADALRLAGTDKAQASERVLAILRMGKHIADNAHSISEWRQGRSIFLVGGDLARLLATRKVYDDPARRARVLEALRDVDRDNPLWVKRSVARFCTLCAHSLRDNQLRVEPWREFAMFTQTDREMLAQTVEYYYQKSLEIWERDDSDLKFEALSYDYNHSRASPILLNCGFFKDDAEAFIARLDALTGAIENAP